MTTLDTLALIDAARTGAVIRRDDQAASVRQAACAELCVAVDTDAADSFTEEGAADSDTVADLDERA